MQDDLTLKYHIRLNPKIWQSNNKLKPEIRSKLNQFAKQWQTFAAIPQAAIVDVILTGGNANFNYTQFSDLDVHIVVDPKKLGWGGNLRDQVQAKKKNWSMTHNVKILDYPVEPYAQDRSDPFPRGQGVYSLTNDRWLQEPVWQTGMNFRNDPLLKQKISHWADVIDDAIKHKVNAATVDTIKTKLRNMRAAAIAKGGEFAPENLVFKELRNKGYLDKLTAYEKTLQKSK